MVWAASLVEREREWDQTNKVEVFPFSTTRRNNNNNNNNESSTTARRRGVDGEAAPTATCSNKGGDHRSVVSSLTMASMGGESGGCVGGIAVEGMTGGSNSSSRRGSSTSGIANYVGKTADSFAQAFVDRWASSHHSIMVEKTEAAATETTADPGMADSGATSSFFSSQPPLPPCSMTKDKKSNNNYDPPPPPPRHHSSNSSIRTATNTTSSPSSSSPDEGSRYHYDGAGGRGIVGRGCAPLLFGAGGSSSNTLWWICDYCQSNAFMTREELHEHVLGCRLNPLAPRSSSSCTSSSGTRSGGSSRRLLLPPGATTTAEVQLESCREIMEPSSYSNSSGMMVARKGWNTTGGQTPSFTTEAIQAINSMHALERTLARSSAASSAYFHSLDGDHSKTMYPAMTTGHHHHHPTGSSSRAAVAAGLQSAWLPTGMNPYTMGTICSDVSMMMNPQNIVYGMGVGGGAGVSYSPLSDGMGSMDNHNSNHHLPTCYDGNDVVAAAAATSQKKSCTPINPELHEASKGPFRQLSKPISLALDDDEHWITPLHCFVRKHYVEVFTATEMDMKTPSKGKRKPIQVGQIGIRCHFCHEGTTDTDPIRERGSVYYPTSLSCIYNATMNLLQRHLRSCPKVPDSIMAKYKELKDDDARSGTSKVYWIESARSLGFVDTLHGIKLSAKEPPPPPSISASQNRTKEEGAMMIRCNEIGTYGNNDCNEIDTSIEEDSSEQDNALDDGVEVANEDDQGTKEGQDETKDSAEEEMLVDKIRESDNGDTTTTTKKKDIPVIANPPSLVDPSDRETATAFSYLLMMQMRSCVFTEADRLGKRKGLPPGFAGLACKHCFGGYGSGRYFPSSIKTISDTSKTLNVLHNHMTRCRRVPKDVIEQLEITRAMHNDERGKMKFGSQKAFFAKVWSRLHGSRPDGAVVNPPSRKSLITTAYDGLRKLSSTQSLTSFSTSSQSGGMPIHRWDAAGMPSHATMNAHDMANSMGGVPHGMQCPRICGESFDPGMMAQTDAGYPSEFLSMGRGLPTHSMGASGSNHESFASFQYNTQQQLFGNGGNGSSKRSLDILLSDEAQEMNNKKMRLSSSSNTADV